MKKNFETVFVCIAALLLFITAPYSMCQSADKIIKKYLSEIPSSPVSKSLQKYKMTAIYTNRDLYGNFTGKTKITGDYTRGLKGDSCRWNNVYISTSSTYEGFFSEGTRQEYIEDFKYKPSPEMLKPVVFSDFPPNPETVFSRNLIWDMMAIEGFAWDNRDSLKLNKIYRIPDADGEFSMADIGSYSHSEIQLCWTGISEFNGVLSALIEFRAIDNKLEINMDAVKTKGTEQYWGTVWVSLDNSEIQHAEMYGGTIQEIKVTGIENKFLVKTIRELWVDKIR